MKYKNLVVPVPGVVGTVDVKAALVVPMVVRSTLATTI